MLKFSRVLIVLVWAFLILRLLTLPLPTDVRLGFVYEDKLAHLFLFSVLTYLLIGAARLFSEKTWPVYAFSLTLSVFYSLSLEYWQRFIPGRFPSAGDFLASALGSFLALALVYYSRKQVKPRLLLHVCCIACGAYAADLLKAVYRPTLYFYNPNIYPETEYFRRLNETKRAAKALGIKVITGEYRHPVWWELVRGHEDDPERGERCLICYRERLEATARLAKSKGFAVFASTLSVSPHKLAENINKIGEELAAKYGLKFLSEDFKKRDGFKKSLEWSRKLKLYRQDYCGCEFSMKKS